MSLYWLWLRFNQVITITRRDNLAIVLHFLSFIIALHGTKLILHYTLYVNNICCPENMEATASGWQQMFYANGRWQPFWKMATIVIRMPICNGPISNSFLNILSYVCTKFGTCITKLTIG